MQARPKRQYGHLKDSLRKQGKSDALAEQIAAQTVDRRRVPRDAAGMSSEIGTGPAQPPATGRGETGRCGG